MRLPVRRGAWFARGVNIVRAATADDDLDLLPGCAPEHLGETLVVEVDGERAGWLQLVHGESTIELTGLHLLAPYQGRGLGTKIMFRLLLEAVHTDRSLIATVRRSDARAIAFLERWLERTGEDAEVRMGADAVEGCGWVATEVPPGTRVLPAVEWPLRELGLQADEYTGPFRTEALRLAEDYDHVHRRTGMSRELFDDVMAWNARSEGLVDVERDERARFAEKQQLLRRLRDEVLPGIAVEQPLDDDAVFVGIHALDVEGGRLVHRARDAAAPREPVLIPPLPDDLARRLVSWVLAGRAHDYDDPAQWAEIHAHQDQGDRFAGELQAALGTGFHVRRHG